MSNTNSRFRYLSFFGAFTSIVSVVFITSCTQNPTGSSVENNSSLNTPIHPAVPMLSEFHLPTSADDSAAITVFGLDPAVTKVADGFVQIDQDRFYKANGATRPQNLAKTAQRELGMGYKWRRADVSNIRIWYSTLSSNPNWWGSMNAATIWWNMSKTQCPPYYNIATFTTVSTVASAQVEVYLAILQPNQAGATYITLEWSNELNGYYIYSALVLLQLGSTYRQSVTCAHELGHVLGLAHTDDPAFTLIAGTPVTEPSSLMNRFITNSTQPITKMDALALYKLYPR